MQKQLHVVRNAAIASGGEGLAALRYAESIARAGCAVTFLSIYLPGNETSSYFGAGKLTKRTAPACRYLVCEVFSQYGYVKRLFEGKEFDLVHLHGMWSPLLAVTALVAYQKKIPFVISPHGCLTPWVLSYKRLKKWLALKTYQGVILHLASLFVATADQEVGDIRQLGLRQNIAVIPNGIDAGNPPINNDADKTIKTILFLSRVHPKKGLLDLVEAWAAVRRPGWRVLIAGGDEDGYRAKVEALALARGVQADFEFVGFVEGDGKQACFDAADIFVLPTYSENFGLVVAEALANEVPVITTTGAPWQDLLEYRCGWWVEPGVAGVATALSDAMSLDPAELRQMGKRGRKVIMEKYSWDHIGIVALNTSEWLLDPSLPKPAIVTDSMNYGV